jgi:dihydropteroate synthase
MPNSQPPSAPVRSKSRRIAVAHVGNQYRCVAHKAIAAGDVIIEITGEIADRPSRFSIQIDATTHIEVPRSLALAEIIARFPWSFLNHSCAPNAAIVGRNLVALTAIAAGAQVTFDYNTTEYEMASPFACNCGAAGCLGHIRGFRHLTAAERLQRRPHLLPYLLKRRDRATKPVRQPTK